ncbi:helix-turn-helix domain-containing protein [Spirillospora sp. NPDC052269]
MRAKGERGGIPGSARAEARRDGEDGARPSDERRTATERLEADERRTVAERLTAAVRSAAERLAGALQRWARRTPSEALSGRPGLSERPDPSAARTTAEFAEQLRRLKRYRGASYREMARLSGGTPVVSTLSQADKGERLPSERTLRAYLRGCRLDEDAMTPWLEARGRLAMDD